MKNGLSFSSIDQLVANIVTVALSLTVILLLIAALYWFSGFRGGKILVALKLRNILSTVDDAENASANANRIANLVVSRSSLRIVDGHIEIFVPVYRLFPFWVNGQVKKIVRERLESESFREYLEENFPGDSFTPPINHGSHFLIESD